MKENNLLFSLKGSETDTARIPDMWTPALFFFQHNFKVLRLIVPTFFLVRWMSVLKIFPQNLGIQNHHLLQYFPSTKWLTVVGEDLYRHSLLSNPIDLSIKYLK